MDKKYKILPKGRNKKKWLDEITDYYIDTSATDDVRDMDNIKANYDLINGLMESDFFNKQLNPLNLPQASNDLPVKEEIIPVILPSINTLIGEIYDRNLDFKAYVNNPSAISQKEEYVKKEFDKKMQAIIENNNLTEEETKLKLMEIQQWSLYGTQDVRERFANHIITDSMERLHYQQVTKNGWKDIIHNSQEIYRFDLVKGNVSFERINPMDVQIYGLPETGNIHEAEAINYKRYLTIGEIVSQYGDYLKESEIKNIISNIGQASQRGGMTMLLSKELYDLNGGVTPEGKSTVPTFEFDSEKNEFFDKNSYIDGDKILVQTIYFKILRRIGNLATIDDETGEEKIIIVDEGYEVNEDMGESIKYEYINEYWESTRIADNTYTKQQRCAVQMRDMNNKSLVTAPIVGKIIMNGKEQAKSIVDNLKPIQYQWTMFSKKMSLLWSRNFGKLVRLDVSKIPKKYGFDVDLFMAWITTFGIILEDPFNEAMKGQPAGQFGSSVQAIDMELSSSISQALQQLIYLKELADEMVGVTRQRKGDLMASDGLGTTQESISRSLKITEEIFQEHHELQKTLLYYILEYSKESLVDGENKKMQYITDDGIFNLYDVEPEQFKDIDYGVFINNSRKQLELEKVFLQLSHAYAQNGAIKMSEIMELYNTSSMSERIMKLKMKEKEQELQQQQMEKANKQHEQQLQEMIIAAEDRKHKHEMELQQLKNEAMILVAQIQAESKLNGELLNADVNTNIADNKNQTEERKAMLQYKAKKEGDKAKTKPKK